MSTRVRRGAFESHARLLCIPFLSRALHRIQLCYSLVGNAKLGDAKLPRELVLRREEAGRYGATECWYLFTKADSTLWVEHVWSRPKDDDTSDVGSETKPPEQILANNDDEELCEALKAAIARWLS